MDNKIKYFLVFFVVLLFVYIFSYNSSDELILDTSISPVKNDIKTTDKDLNNGEKDRDIKPSIVNEEPKNSSMIENKQEDIVKDEYIILDVISSTKYKIKIVSDKKVESQDSSTLYIPFRGKVINEKGSHDFNFSLDKKYIDFTDYIRILIDDITTERKDDFICDGYFLGGLSEDNIYNMAIELYGDTANCYLTDTIQLPTKTKQLLEGMKNITLGTDGKLTFPNMNRENENNNMINIPFDKNNKK